MQLRQKAMMAATLLMSAYSTLSGAAEPIKSEESEWIFITENVDYTRLYSGKSGTFELTSTKAGNSVAMILGQIEDKTNKSITYGKWYVSTNDCEAGMGKLVFLTISGEFNRESEFVSSGNNIASGVADFICSVYHLGLEEKKGKGV